MTSGTPSSPRPRIPTKYIAVVFAAAVLVPIAVLGWRELYATFLEPVAPVIRLVEVPRGVGALPITIQIDLEDSGAGLEDVVVKSVQRRVARELLRKSLGGAAHVVERIEFAGEKSELEEGPAEIVIQVYDRSFWSNGAELAIPIMVDYRRPKVEIISTQHNARRGGSQFIFYRAIDENLAVSGVKIGGQSFEGFQARGIDKAFDDPSLYVAPYALDLETTNVDAVPMRVFAVDGVGNSASGTFYHNNTERKLRDRDIVLTERFLREQMAPLAQESLGLLQDQAKKAGEELAFTSERGSDARLLEEYRLLITKLRQYNNDQLLLLLKRAPRNERYWQDSFRFPVGTPEIAFADRVRVAFGNAPIGDYLSTAYEIRPQGESRSVMATNDGVVILAERLGVFGRIVGIDHGFGIVSLYGYLDDFSVKKGDFVKKDDIIGVMGHTGLARATSLFFQMRVQGVPVDPLEWWERSWFQDHVAGKINDVKKQLGIPILVPVR